MLMRRSHALREIHVDDSSDHRVAASALEILDVSPDPETSYLRQERVEILSKTIGNLRPGLRLAVVLRELAELSTEETARRMGLSVAAVKARCFHAKRKLREKLSRYVKSNPANGRSPSPLADTISQNRLCNASGL